MKTEQLLTPKAVKQQRTRLWLAVVTTVMAAIGLTLLTANLTGSARFISVLSDTMEPAISKGSIAVLHSTPPNEVKEGDIIAVGVNSLSESRISRIDSIEFSGGGVYSYTLWADNTPLQDPWLHRTINDIQVVSWSAPFLGWVALVISNPFFVVLMVAGSIYFAYYYTVKIFEYNRRQVYARRIAEERLENSKHGGLNDVVDLFAEVGEVTVKVGKSGPVKVSSREELDILEAEQMKLMREKILAKLEKKHGKAVEEEKESI